MKLHCCPETDSLYIAPTASPGGETREVATGLSLDIDHASRTFCLTSQESVALPIGGACVA